MHRYQRTAAAILLMVVWLLLGACNGLWGISKRGVVPNLTCDDDGCRCSEGFDDCDGDSENGCEADLDTNARCGGCKNSCNNGGCVERTCLCDEGFADCDGKPENGCEADLSSPDSCGGCQNSCKNGSCTKRICQCSSGYKNCNDDATDGCEARLNADVHNCGSCGRDCLDGTCQAGQCQPIPLAKAAGLDRYTRLVIDGNHLYAAYCEKAFDISAMHISRAPTSAGVWSSYFDEGTDCQSGDVTLAAGELYWVGKDRIYALSLSETPHLRTVTVPIEGLLPYYTVGGGYVYWLQKQGTEVWLSRAHAQTGAIESALWRLPNDTAGALHANAQGVYVTPRSRIFFLPHQGTAQQIFDVPSVTYFYHIDLIGEHLVWLASTDGHKEIAMALATGGTPTRIEQATKDIVGNYTTSHFISDDKAIYWLNNGSLKKVNLNEPTKPLTLASSLVLFKDPIALDAHYVYWIGNTNGTPQLMKLAK